MTYRRILVGLTLALVLVTGLGLALQAGASRAQSDELARRAAVMRLQALAETVERVGLESDRLQGVVADWVERDEVLTQARVFRFQGIRLLASTAPEDVGETSAPRKMSRDEKPLYDLGQTLRAAVETNLQEGRAFKEELDVQPREGGGLALAAPLEADGSIVGALLADAAPPAPARGGGVGAALAVLGAGLALFLAAGFALRGRPGAALVVAAVVAIAATVAHGWIGLGGLAEGRRAGEAGLAEELAHQRQAAADTLAAAGVPAAEPLEAASWDTDDFRRPLGLVEPGRVDTTAVEEQLGGRRGAYWQRIAPFAALGLVLLVWVGRGGAARTGRILSRHRLAYAYVSPAMLGMTVLVFLPFFYGILLAFTNSNIYNTDRGLAEIWVGLDNFVEIVTDFEIVKETADGRVFDYQNFYWTLGFTIVWTIANVAVGVSFGLLLALILNRKGFVLKPIYRVLLILPWAVPNYITALIWRGMFHSQFGVVNQVIQMFGGEAVSWFDTPFRAFITVLSTNGWLSFPFMMVISLGALQSIPSDLYEAARVDGAGRWHQFKTITLPSLKPALVPAIILSVIWTFNQFNVIYLVSAGEPGHSTEILITEAYKIAFEQYRYGYAAAYSVLIFLILLAYGVWQNRVTGATEGI